MRLLIVEDSALIRKVTQLALPAREHELQEAGNGLEALALLASAPTPFDVILLDLRMPDMNGVKFLRALRQRPLHADTPVVVATSQADPSALVDEARRLGVAAIVREPWKPQELAQLVRKVCGSPCAPKEPPS